MPHFSWIRLLVSVLVLTAAVTDIRSRRIPNWLTLSGVCVGLGANFALSGWPGLKSSLSGLALGFGVYFVLYALRAMGAGDVKLMAAVGSIVGPESWIAVFIASAIAGGIFAAFLMIRKGRVRQTLGNTAFIAGELMQFRAPHQSRSDLDVKNPNALRLPHGVAIATGTVACLFFAAI